MRFRLLVRDRIAFETLSGSGVEIGAQHRPTQINRSKATIEYVDRLPAEALAVQFGLPVDRLVPVSHLIDGARLDVYPDGSRDFLIANHVLEHFDDPIGGLIEWFRILSDGGKLFITVPNYRNNWFDFRRRPPTRRHFAQDFRDKEYREQNNRLHYADMVQSLYQFDDSDPLILATADAWIANGDRNHYHVYDEQALRDVLLLVAKELNSTLRIEGSFLLEQGFEHLVVISKRAGPAELRWPSSFASRISALKALVSLAIPDLFSFYCGRPRDQEPDGAIIPAAIFSGKP